MPALATVIAGDIRSEWEVVSTAGRVYNFALTVRDNRMPNGGQTTRDNVVVTASNTIGPFSVSSQNATVGWAQGSTQTITWVRNGAETLSANVDIYLSTDGGLTFPTLLTPSGVPNSGSATITVPNVVTQTARIMVRAKENIYYAVNSRNILIGYSVTNTCTTYPFNTAFSPTDGSNVYAQRSITVPTTTSTISDVNINVNATHPNIQHLNFAVARPGASLLVLYNQGCASGANMNVTWDAQGSALTCASPTQGTYVPVGDLNSMIGANPSGNWIMGFRDLVAGTTGTINSFSIEICSQTIALLGNDSFSFDNFSLYPNPNDGTFTVKFNSNTGNEINVAVYDMRGRSIFNNVYQNNGVFEQTLQLDNVQSGIYLVNIQDGDKKVVKKIVVE
jgi:subtilisin-like proprotein convertase family protein